MESPHLSPVVNTITSIFINIFEIKKKVSDPSTRGLIEPTTCMILYSSGVQYMGRNLAAPNRVAENYLGVAR